jgi:hypothetical protein
VPRWRGIQWHAVHVEFHEKTSVIICNTDICSLVGIDTDPHNLLNRVLEREMLGCSGTLIKELSYFDTFSVTYFWLILFWRQCEKHIDIFLAYTFLEAM